jgi:hypothetical protein
VCLFSAPQFHNLTTQWPAEVSGWALDRKARRPRSRHLPRVVRFPVRAADARVEEHVIEGVRVRSQCREDGGRLLGTATRSAATSPLEALRDCRGKRRASADDLWEAAKVCRVANVMRPYLRVCRDQGASVQRGGVRERSPAATRRQRGETHQMLLIRYALERLLYRLAVSNTPDTSPQRAVARCGGQAAPADSATSICSGKANRASSGWSRSFATSRAETVEDDGLRFDPESVQGQRIEGG